MCLLPIGMIIIFFSQIKLIEIETEFDWLKINHIFHRDILSEKKYYIRIVTNK